MIRAVAWCRAEDCGALVAGGSPVFRPAPVLSSHQEMTALVQRPLKYLGRMTHECRLSLCAASLALQATHWHDAPSIETGLLAAGDGGFLLANEKYFRDYVDGGRSMGRGNLFIYTLPTSTLGELAIALNLTGPSLHLHDDAQPLASLVQQAGQLIADGEAAGMLLLWSDLRAAVCLAVDGAADESSPATIALPDQSTPTQMACDLAATSRPA